MLSVNATCGWCQVKVETTVEKPMPDGWVERDVRSPDFGAGVAVQKETFCKAPCSDKYEASAAACHAKAAADYKTAFLQAMNNARKEK